MKYKGSVFELARQMAISYWQPDSFFDQFGIEKRIS